MKIENQLEQIAKSYDRHIIEFGKDDAPSYDNLPDYITGNPDYQHRIKENESDWEEIRRKKLKDYLSPTQNMNFIHLGCSLNLMFKGYDKWPSTYYGIDISKATINLLYNYVVEHNLSIGSLYCGSIHETPFAESYFDIGDCIGVLEYFDRDFILKAIQEFHRLMKPDGKLVLDIPNIASPSGRMAMLIEEYMGRPDKFDMLSHEFEDMIKDYFEIVDSDRICAERRGENYIGHMYYYFLKCKK
ncbi:MAG: class I SAM-dependent methyltransferase [Oscillospiraceae bacterium]|nr:class I SAM-dependent methyltransferase [Oscillospiraceae bacterium]